MDQGRANYRNPLTSVERLPASGGDPKRRMTRSAPGGEIGRNTFLSVHDLAACNDRTKT